MSEKNYGMKWFHFSHAFRAPVGVLMSAMALFLSYGAFRSGIPILSVALVIGGALGTLVYLPLTIGYYRNRHIGIYPAWMLKLMLAKLWGEFTALFLIYAVTIGIGAEALGGLIPLLVTTIAETVYFANRESQAYV